MVTHSGNRDDGVLLSWLALNNDPYERERSGEHRLVDGQQVSGPTLTVLLDPESPLKGRISDVVLIHRVNATRDSRELDVARETRDEVERLTEGRVRVTLVEWPSPDPTDHQAIFGFLKKTVPELRSRFLDRELLVHISPGTPAMHTVWVLMAETGFIEKPYRVIQSFRPRERRGGPAVADVDLGIETFYKAYRASQPREITSDEDRIYWDPARFRTDRMRQVFAEARRFAQLDVPVLILGEPGTGKTTLASWIRLKSPYHRPELDREWPNVPCGQYTPATMRAELFGHAKGAFTGAVEEKDGLLASADGDTLFLDEIGDVSHDVQRLLIKAVEEKTYHRLGEQKLRRSDFRLIAATNLSMSKLKERVSQDFLDRINYLVLELPALREIREELGWLWESTYEQAIRRSRVAPDTVRLTPEENDAVIEALAGHPLPGNLRDLLTLGFRLIAARCDPDDRVPLDEAIDAALAAVGEPHDTSDVSIAKAVAGAFSESASLDSVLALAGTLQTKTIEGLFRGYMAEELRRIGGTRGVPVNELADVSDRTLREWVKG